MAELVSSSRGQFVGSNDEVYDYRCVYCCDANGENTVVLSNVPCSTTYGQANLGSSSVSMGTADRGYNPNRVRAGNSMALQQADLGQGQLVNTARGLRFMRYPSVARMKPVSLYARPSSPVTPKVSATRELARRKRSPFLNMNVSRKRQS